MFNIIVITIDFNVFTEPGTLFMVGYKTLMTVLTVFRSPTFKREERNIRGGGGGGKVTRANVENNKNAKGVVNKTVFN